MQDSFNRKITYMRVSITDRCNLRCTYCMPTGLFHCRKREEILNYEEMLRIISVAAKCGIRKVRVTGGEPLVRKGAVDFIASLAGIKGIQEVALSTNGVLFKKFGRDLYRAGLRKVNFSLDSLVPEKFARITQKDAFPEVWAGIQEAERLGFSPIKINVVIQKGVNDDEIIELARLSLKRPFHVRFIELMPCNGWQGWGRDFLPVGNVKAVIEEKLNAFWRISAIHGSSGPAQVYRFPKAMGTVGFISPISDPGFCQRCNRVRLTAEGKLHPCLFGESGIDFREPLRRGCDDEEIERLFDQAVKIKPASHELGGFYRKQTNFAMVQIGG